MGISFKSSSKSVVCQQHSESLRRADLATYILNFGLLLFPWPFLVRKWTSKAAGLKTVPHGQKLPHPEHPIYARGMDLHKSNQSQTNPTKPCSKNTFPPKTLAVKQQNMRIQDLHPTPTEPFWSALLEAAFHHLSHCPHVARKRHGIPHLANGAQRWETTAVSPGKAGVGLFWFFLGGAMQRMMPQITK